MKRLVFLEDEDILREEIADFLRDQGYLVDAVASIGEFKQCYDPGQHRLALLDLGLPDGDGRELIRELRSRGHRVGIVVLTARGGTRDKVAGLAEGADYYLAKTVDLDELAATLAALVRRLGAPEKSACWTLELGARRLIPPGYQPLPLSQQDLTVLQILLQRPGVAVSRRQIIEAQGENYLDYDQRRLDTQISRLRRKTEEVCGLALPLNTLRNAGYCFFAEAEIVA